MLAILETLLLLFFGFVSLLMIGVVLIQKGRGGGLASAFGGGSGTATAFGSKTGDVLTWATSVIFGVFLILAITLNLIANFRSPPPVAGGIANPPVAPAEPLPIAIPPVPTAPGETPPATPTPESANPQLPPLQETPPAVPPATQP